MDAVGSQNRKTRTVSQAPRNSHHAKPRELSTIRWMRVQTAGDFLKGFCERVRAARKARGLTQMEMAAALGIGHEAYRAYEKRTPLPHFLVERFARITGVEIEYLFNGRQSRRGTAEEIKPGAIDPIDR